MTRFLAVLAFAAVATGCTHSVRDAIHDCTPGTSECMPEQAAVLPESHLRLYGDTLIVACPLADAITASYRADCFKSISRLIVHLNRRFPNALGPIDPSTLSYSEEEVYMDTFVPGREFEDLARSLAVRVPLNWRE